MERNVVQKEFRIFFINGDAHGAHHRSGHGQEQRPAAGSVFWSVSPRAFRAFPELPLGSLGLTLSSHRNAQQPVVPLHRILSGGNVAMKSQLLETFRKWDFRLELSDWPLPLVLRPPTTRSAET